VSEVRDPRVAAAGGLLVTAAMLVLSGCASTDPGSEAPVSGVTVQDDDGMNGIVLPKPYQVADLTLRATDGSAYRLVDDTDKPLTLVFFGYTRCPDICQVVMADIASALVRLEDDERSQVGMLFVTTDPARDDAATLRAYLDRFDPSFEGLTGPLPRIVEAGKSLGVAVEKGEKLPSGGYEVTHGTQVVGVLPDGTAPLVWTHGTSPEQIAEDIHVALSEGGVPTGETQ
jgi:protein SCO1/2